MRFTNVRAPRGTPGTWYEAAVEIDARPGPGKFANRVRVILSLGFELPAPPGGSRHVEYYRTEAELVALETGRAIVRFYLPPELVKRDSLRADPKFWSAELSIGGQPLPAARGRFSAALANADSRKSFQSRVAADGSANDGLLQAQYLTPFALEYPLATPSFVRRESIR